MTLRIVLFLTLSLAVTLPAADAPKAEAPKLAGLPVAPLARGTPVDFETEILPFLKTSCLACHNTTKAKAGLNLETPQLILKGGDTGPGLVPGKAAESLIFKASAHLDSELIMPPRDNKANAANLASEQLALLKLWVDQGGKGEVKGSTVVNWLDKPPVLDPIFALALTADGQFSACGRGNQIFVYHLPSGRLVGQLADTRRQTNSAPIGAAHRDIVNSLAFNPDGSLLASGGYREVKLWRRHPLAETPAPALTNASVITVSPDKKSLAAVVGDVGVTLYDAVTGHALRSLLGPSNSNRVLTLRFSPDGMRIAAVSLDQTLRVWTVADGTLVASAETTNALETVAWVADGKQLVSGGRDGFVRFWDLPTGTNTLLQSKERKAHDGAVTALEAGPGGKLFVSGGVDGLLRVWNLDADKPVREMKHESPVTALVMALEGGRVASAGTNPTVKLWSMTDGKLVAELKGDRYASERAAELERGVFIAKGDVEFRKKSLETADAEFKKQTERLAKATETNSVTEKVFAEMEKGWKVAQTAKATAEKALTDFLTETKRVTEAYDKADKAAREISAKAKLAAVHAGDAQLAGERAGIARAEAEKIAADAASMAAKSKSAAVNTDAAKETAKRIADESAAVAEKSKAFVDAVAADADTKSRLALEAKAGAEKAIEEVAAFSFALGQLKPGYDKILAEGPERRKQATNQIETATKNLAAAEGEYKKAETRKSVTGHELELAQAAKKRTGEALELAKSAVALVETALKDTDGRLAQARKAAAEAELSTLALAVSPDGITLATLARDGRVLTWNAANGVAYDVFPSGTETDGRGSVAFRDAHTLLAVRGRSSKPVCWELNPSWMLERTLGTGEADSALGDRVNAVRFSPDGKSLATGSGEPTRTGEIKLWNVADGTALRSFDHVHSDAVLSLDYSPDSLYLASSSADRFVRVVELATGKIVKAFEGHTSYVLSVAWKRDSRTIASAGADSVIKIWDFVTGDRKKNIEGASKEVTSITFVGVTDQTLSTSGDNQVRLVKENGDKIRSFEGVSEFMQSCAATPDGRLVVAGGQDGVLRVWNGTNGEKIFALAPPGKGKGGVGQ